eukprot:scaffold310972_cov32-Tisochrysis_lutea.AAC.4
MPALHTRHLRGGQPPASLIFANCCANAATDLSERRSSSIQETGPGFDMLASICALRASALASERAARTSLPPSEASAIAVLTPIPVVGPVMIVVAWRSSSHPSGNARITSSHRDHLESADAPPSMPPALFFLPFMCPPCLSTSLFIASTRGSVDFLCVLRCPSI